MKCPNCGTETRHTGTSTTLVGFSPRLIDGVEHDHDDNCLKRGYACNSCGHDWAESVRRTCSVPSCAWRGKETCFCHAGPKVDAWSDPEDYYTDALQKYLDDQRRVRER